jgi:hypothetical protein
MYLRGKIDLHIHTTVSDGSDSPEEILRAVKNTGLVFFAVSDHDAVKGCRIVRGLLGADDPAFVNGAEFSCMDELGKYHILGYAYDPEAAAMRELVGRGHGLRMKKVKARLDFIRDEFGFSFPEEEIQTLLAMDNPGKPHIGNLMVKYGYAKSKEEAIHDYINRKRFKNEFVRPEEAIAGILKSGGIPVLAHPAFGSGDELIVGEEMEQRLKRLIGYGLQGVEAFYSGFPPKLKSEMLKYAARYELYVTAGSDYHGKNKLIPLGDTGMEKNTPVPEGMLRFMEAVDPKLPGLLLSR